MRLFTGCLVYKVFGLVDCENPSPSVAVSQKIQSLSVLTHIKAERDQLGWFAWGHIETKIYSLAPVNYNKVRLYSPVNHIESINKQLIIQR